MNGWWLYFAGTLPFFVIGCRKTYWVLTNDGPTNDPTYQVMCASLSVVAGVCVAMVWPLALVGFVSRHWLFQSKTDRKAAELAAREQHIADMEHQLGIIP